MSCSLQRGQLAVGGCEHSIRKSSIIFNEGGVCWWGRDELIFPGRKRINQEGKDEEVEEDY